MHPLTCLYIRLSYYYDQTLLTFCSLLSCTLQVKIADLLSFICGYIQMLGWKSRHSNQNKPVCCTATVHIK